MKMIEVAVDGVSYAIYSDTLGYLLKEEDEVVFEDKDFDKVREKLFEVTGV